MRLFRRPMRFWTLTALFCLAGAAAAGTIAYLYLAPSEAARMDLLKIYVQAIFVTLAGGVLVTFLNVRRDEDQRDLAREVAVREIVEQMHKVHRKLKTVKRRLRSRMTPPADRPGAPRALPYRIPVATFEAAMEDLLATQIEAEQIRDAIPARSDLLAPDQIARVHTALDYAARYAHDVYQNFEDCTVAQADGHYVITERCAALTDFLGRQAWDRVHGLPQAAALTEAYQILASDDADLGDRYDALGEIERLRAGVPGQPRYRIVATQCVALAASDLQGAVARERWQALAAPRAGGAAQAAG